MRKKVVKNKFLFRRIVIVVLALLILFLIIKGILGLFLKIKTRDDIGFLLDNKLVELKNEIYIDDNKVVYISKDDIENIFDKTIYYNDAEKELITTFNKHIAVLKANENSMTLNDSSVELKGTLLEKDKKVYLPISEMGIVYDLEFEYSEEGKMFIADSVSKEKKQSITLKKVAVKEKPNIFSKKVEKLEQGEYVVVIGEDGNYREIRTPSGNIGYVKYKKISDPEKVRDNWVVTEVKANILKDASDMSKNYSKVSVDKSLTNVVIPTFFYIDENSTILDKTGSTTEEYSNYMNWLKSNEIEVWATLSNNVEISNSLRNYEERNKVINSLYYTLVDHEFSGVNINFEKIDDVNSFNRFIIELTPRLKELGLKVAVTKNSNVDDSKFKDIVDIVIE